MKNNNPSRIAIPGRIAIQPDLLSCKTKTWVCMDMKEINLLLNTAKNTRGKGELLLH